MGEGEEVGGGGKQCLAEGEAVPLLARCNTSPKMERTYMGLQGDQSGVHFPLDSPLSVVVCLIMRDSPACDCPSS